MRHADFFVELAAHADEQFRGPDQPEWLERLDGERDNLRAALRWALAGGDAERGVRLAATLPAYWDLRAQFSEARVWLAGALDRVADVPPQLRAEALTGAAQMALAWGDHASAAAQAAQALELLDSAGPDWARATMLLGLAALYRGNYADAAPLLESCRDEFARLGRSWEHAAVLGRLGQLSRMRGEYAAARARFDGALRLSRRIGDDGGTAWTVWQLGVLARYEGEYDRAELLCEESLPMFERIGDQSGSRMCSTPSATSPGCAATTRVRATGTRRAW
jgi:tetratricopeptide (TPR) repeat protein